MRRSSSGSQIIFFGAKNGERRGKNSQPSQLTMEEVSSHVDKKGSLTRTFYLYSFKDDMTLAAGTQVEKEDFEVIRFNSRSLEDLSKFDWSGGASTHNQSEFCKVIISLYISNNFYFFYLIRFVFKIFILLINSNNVLLYYFKRFSKKRYQQ